MMKNIFLITSLVMTTFLISCSKDMEENEEFVTKDLPMRWAPHSCNYHDPFGPYVGSGTKCAYDQAGGCKWPSKCKLVSSSFVTLATQTIPGLNADTWGNEIPLTGYDLQLMLWLEDPYNHYHPDSIPTDTIQ